MGETLNDRADTAIQRRARFYETDVANAEYLIKLSKYIFRLVSIMRGSPNARRELSDLLKPENVPQWDPEKAKQALLRYVEDATAIQGAPPVDPKA